VRRRIKDKRVLELVKAFLRAGTLGEDGIDRDTHTGTPQGGILSPLLANIALSELDDYFHRVWESHKNPTDRMRHRRRGGATFRLTRYADLCRTRHKSAYAGRRVMPRRVCRRWSG
jgi:RNA-directed DNA polymerase